MFCVFMERDSIEWEKYLGAATLCFNTKISQSTGMMPFKAMMGREARLPVDLILPTPRPSYETPEM